MIALFVVITWGLLTSGFMYVAAGFGAYGILKTRNGIRAILQHRQNNRDALEAFNKIKPVLDEQLEKILKEIEGSDGWTITHLDADGNVIPDDESPNDDTNSTHNDVDEDNNDVK